MPRTPDLRVNVDRTLASQMGLSQRDVASDLLISLSSSNQTAPNFWLNPENGVNYSIFVQTPQYQMDSINALENTPVVPTALAGPRRTNTQLLGNLATIDRGVSPTNVTHYNIQPTLRRAAGRPGTDLGSVAKARSARSSTKFRPQLPRGSIIGVARAGRRACTRRSPGWPTG